jgi:hypothetical protein
MHRPGGLLVLGFLQAWDRFYWPQAQENVAINLIWRNQLTHFIFFLDEHCLKLQKHKIMALIHVSKIFLFWLGISKKVTWLCLPENGEAIRHLGFLLFQTLFISLATHVVDT